MTSRYTPHPDLFATGPAAEVHAQVLKGVGRVPNAYAALAALQPKALQAMLQADNAAAPGGLSIQEKEVIKLLVSHLAGCDYCEAAHYMIGKMRGLEPQVLQQVRNGQPTGDERRDALVALVLHLVRHQGTVPEALYQRMRAAGYSDAQLAEVALTIAVIVFTNIFNRINDTELDFPAIA